MSVDIDLPLKLDGLSGVFETEGGEELKPE